jgi:hypothetical protein
MVEEVSAGVPPDELHLTPLQELSSPDETVDIDEDDDGEGWTSGDWGSEAEA